MGKQEDLSAAVRDHDLSSIIKLTGKLSKSKLIGSAKKLNFNQVDSNGLSLLHHAATSDNAEIVKILIEHGATVDVMDSQGIRPLHVAAQQGHARSVAQLISCGSSVNDPAFDGSTPLHMACEHGHLETVEHLLNNQGDPSAYNREHKTAFDVACEFGHLKVVEKFVCSAQCGPLIRDYKQKTREVKRTTCLHLATANGHVNILRFLFEAGFDVNRQTGHGTCLHEAVMHGQIKATKFLLDWGVSLHARNSCNQTAFEVLHSAQKPFQPNEKLLRLLTDAPFQPLTVRAVRLYHCPQQQNQLTFREGDLIRVVERRSDDTWKGYLFRDSDMMQQHVGYFPSSEVEILRSSDAPEDGLSMPCLPFSLSCQSSPQCASSSHQCLSPVHHHHHHHPHHHLAKLSPVSTSTDRADRTAEWIVQSADATEHASGSPMSSKDNVSESNRSSTSSSSGSSGYLGSNSQVNTSGVFCQPNRLSGQSCESGVASLWPSTHCLPVSTSQSSHSGLDWLDEGGHSGGPVNVNELIQQGLKDSDIMYIWLHQLQLADCYQLFLHAGYDMPTISRMTPEDLTAIGITQPSIRKRLTSEISRLKLSDRIPNFRPNNLLEWLQLLNLDEHHSTLVRDGYSSIDRVTEITWEDLEDVGIHKLGHQKKLLLAIDRMKKLTSGKTVSGELEHPHNMEPKSAVSIDTNTPRAEASMAKPSTPHPPGCSSEKNFSKQVPLKTNEGKEGTPVRSVIRLPPQTPFVHPSHLSTVPQTSSHTPVVVSHSEVIAIQVNRPASSRTGSIKERSSDKMDAQHMMYKSFHGNSSKDFDSDGETMPTDDRGSTSTDETEDNSAMQSKCRPRVALKPDGGYVRRASGSIVRTTASTDIASSHPNPYCKAFQPESGLHQSPVDWSRKNLDVPTGITHSSAPTTPSHFALVDSSAATRPKKPIPLPPKRSNSIKDKTTGDVTGAQDPAKPDVSKSMINVAHQLAVAETTSLSAVPDSSSDVICTRPKHSDCTLTELDNPLSRVIARLEWKDDQVVRPTKIKDNSKSSGVCSPAPPYSASAHSSHSSTDCNTLPFANENIGTIKQRNPGKPVATPGDPLVRRNSQDLGSGSPGPRRASSEITAAEGRLLQKQEARKPPPVPSKKPVLGKNEPNSEVGLTSKPSIGPEGSDVFDDIDSLFQGLTQELNQMLTFDG